MRPHRERCHGQRQAPAEVRMSSLYVRRHTRKPAREVTAEQRKAAARPVHQHAARRRRGREGGARQGPEGAATSWRSRAARAGRRRRCRNTWKGTEATEQELRAEYDAQVAALPARISRAPHPGRRPGSGRDDHQGAQRRRRLRQAGEQGIEGLLQQERRRSRLVHARHAWSSRSPTRCRRCSRASSREQPVQSQYGWHVIKLEESRATSAPPFDEVKDRVKVDGPAQEAADAPGRAAKTAQDRGEDDLSGCASHARH